GPRDGRGSCGTADQAACGASQRAVTREAIGHTGQMTSTVAPKVPDGADPHDSGDSGDPRDPRDPRGLRSGAPLLDAWLRASAAGSAAGGGDAARMSIPGHKQRAD